MSFKPHKDEVVHSSRTAELVFTEDALNRPARPSAPFKCISTLHTEQPEHNVCVCV